MPVQTLTRATTTSAGAQITGTIISEAIISNDGTMVAFNATDTTLIAGDTNNFADIFVKNLTTGAISRVSTTGGGGAADGSSGVVDFTPDGTRVVFASGATNLAGLDQNAAHDVFVKNLTTGVVQRASETVGGVAG